MMNQVVKSQGIYRCPLITHLLTQNTTTSLKKAMTFQYQLEDLTLDDIRSASTNYLRSCLKEDIDPYVHDMIEKELYVREQRRPIV